MTGFVLRLESAWRPNDWWATTQLQRRAMSIEASHELSTFDRRLFLEIACTIGRRGILKKLMTKF